MLSVSQILAKRFDRSDPWMLALVQRDRVWDEYRIARLLDSLVQNYPIGTLILCQSQTPVPAFDGERKVADAGASWQILDGQQRINALSEIFSATPGPFHFFLHMSAARPQDLAVGGKDERIRQYITWVCATELGRDDLFQGRRGLQSERSHWLDLSCFGEKLRSGSAVCPDHPESFGMANWREWLNSIDNKFSLIFQGPEQEANFLDRCKQLIHIWRDEIIPVQDLNLKGPEEILQVFARLNMEGIRTSPADVFFAGVKTRWRTAEERLRAITKASGEVVNRMTALEIVARLASYERNEDDLLPLDLKRLKGNKGGQLIDTMESIAISPDFLWRVEKLSRYLREESGLGFGLQCVDHNLLPHVFAWAAKHSELDTSGRNSAALYLLGATLFRLYGTFRDRFSRLAMKLSIEAGRSSRSFPTEEVLERIRDNWPDLPLPRPSTPQKVRDEFVNSGPWRLFLSVAQDIPFSPCYPIEWDHIYPQSQRHRMKLRRPGWPKAAFHADHKLVWRAGNMCALHARLNEAAQDERPRQKLQKLRNADYGYALQPESLFLSDKEEALLIQADNLLDANKTECQQIDNAMETFKQYVESREERMWNVLLDRFPRLKVFEDWVSQGMV